jgi:RHS repeat-associated protein
LGVPLVTTDASGAVATPTGYTMPGYPGQQRTLADLYYNRHRDYDSSTGRYIQADPIGLEGGDNPYLYAEGNPLRYVDPNGQAGIVITYFLGKAVYWPTTPEVPGYCPIQDGAALEMSKGGKKNIQNEITRSLLASREPNPCDVLREMRLQEADPVMLRKIKQAEKYFNCDKRNRFQ